jgi:DNA (cytosine-5)-methyltransferase 1
MSISSPKYSVVSLFSGCGGLDLGFLGDFEIFGNKYERNPFNIIWSNDIFKEACESYRFNIGSHIYEGDISQLDKNIIPKADVVIGGFPCQDFSVAGKRQGITVKRGRLYLEMQDVIRYVAPRMFIAENVEGLINLEDGLILKTIKKDLSNIKRDNKDTIRYNVSHILLNAADYGVPQVRKRVFIVGIRKDLNIRNLQYIPPVETHKNKWMSSKDAIDDLWGKELDLTIPNHSQYSRAKFYPGRRMQGNTQIRSDQPSITIRAEHHGNIEAHYRSNNPENPEDMNSWRRLTVRECARIQTFPDNFIFQGSGSMAYKQIGNAVPPILGWHIAKSIASTLTKLTSQPENSREEYLVRS